MRKIATKWNRRDIDNESERECESAKNEWNKILIIYIHIWDGYNMNLRPYTMLLFTKNKTNPFWTRRPETTAACKQIIQLILHANANTKLYKLYIYYIAIGTKMLPDENRTKSKER